MPATATDAFLSHLTAQFGLAQWVLMTNLEDLSNEDGLRPPQPAGNTINFVVGHVMSARNGMLKLLGRKPLWDEKIINQYNEDGEALRKSGKALPLAQLKADLERSHDEIVEALKHVTQEQLAAKAPFSPSGNADETVGSLLTTFAFHEAYHVGQTGLLRRLCGKPGAIKPPPEVTSS